VYDDIEDMRDGSAPTCPWPIGATACGADAFYVWDIGFQGRLSKVRSCGLHARQAKANFESILAIGFWSGEYQVSGIESTLPAEPPAPTLRAEQVIEPLPAVEAPKRETRALSVAHVPLSKHQQATIARVTASLAPKKTLPKGYDPNDPRIVAGTHVYCAHEVNGEVCGAVLLRSNKSNEAKKHGIPTYQLRLLPEGRLKCEDVNHHAAGCCQTFTNEGDRNGHYSRAKIPPAPPKSKPAIGAVPFQRPPVEDAATAEH
jgi:hypothetical protein